MLDNFNAAVTEPDTDNTEISIDDVDSVTQALQSDRRFSPESLVLPTTQPV